MLACIASILERPLESIPDFALSGCGWFEDLYEWCLNEKIGLLCVHPKDLALIGSQQETVVTLTGSADALPLLGTVFVDSSGVDANDTRNAYLWWAGSWKRWQSADTLQARSGLWFVQGSTGVTVS